MLSIREDWVEGCGEREEGSVRNRAVTGAGACDRSPESFVKGLGPAYVLAPGNAAEVVPNRGSSCFRELLWRRADLLNSRGHISALKYEGSLRADSACLGFKH
jgi:hypothetical protein